MCSQGVGTERTTATTAKGHTISALHQEKLARNQRAMHVLGSVGTERTLRLCFSPPLHP
eukprot:m.98392 g.98392  ORF g.98392 m.98392 type:complete len:59 (+) comp16745_c0_seq3:699-875(+)